MVVFYFTYDLITNVAKGVVNNDDVLVLFRTKEILS